MQSFFRWGFTMGVISLLLLFSYFFMMLSLVISPIGIIISAVNFIVNRKQGNNKEKNYAIVGFVINTGVLIYLIYFLTHSMV